MEPHGSQPGSSWLRSELHRNFIKLIQAQRPYSTFNNPFRILKNLFGFFRTFENPTGPERTFLEPLQNLSETFSSFQKVGDPYSTLENLAELWCLGSEKLSETSANLGECLGTFANLSEPHRTSANSSEPLRTVASRR